jgi:hypothetical protein
MVALVVMVAMAFLAAAVVHRLLLVVETILQVTVVQV